MDVDVKKEISRLRSEVRKLSQQPENKISTHTGVVSGNYWTQTGMPWASSEGRKAVLTEYFWQPIRGQPRRVDTNELRQFSQTFWVNACVKTLMDEIGSLDWDIVPKDGFEYEWVEEEIEYVKGFLKNPNKNRESFNYIIKALIKDVLEIDAGVIVKVFDINSYDFDNVEPKSGAPILKPKGQRTMTEMYVRDGASFLKEIDKFGFVKGYWQYSYQIPAHPMWFNEEEILYVSEHPRSMSCYGFARTQGILDIVKSLHYSTLYNKKFFEESPIPDGALSLLDTNEIEMKDFMAYWNMEFKAQPHKVAVVNKDLKWQPFVSSNRELEFLDTQKWYFNMVVSEFGLTPAELGVTDDLNRATSATQSELVKRKGVRPFLKLLENYLNDGVISEFGYEGVEFQFIYDDPAEKKLRLENFNLELNMGISTINEVREEIGKEPIEGGDATNSWQSRLSAQAEMLGATQDRGEGKNEFSGYSAERDRAEGKSEAKDEKKAWLKKDDYKTMPLSQLIAEHKELVRILESGSEEEKRNLLAEQAKELQEYINESNRSSVKGVDDGQYYRDQMIATPSRPSGAMFQPQNPEPTGKPFRAETSPSLLGDANAKQSTKGDMVHCPICGLPALASLNALETMREDIRCTQCGARFNSNDLREAPLMEEISNALQANNVVAPVSIPDWKIKGFTKSVDLDMDLKSFVGFDVSKSSPQMDEYVNSKEYKDLMRSYLGELSPVKRSRIISVLKNSLKSSDTIRQVASKISQIIEDPARAEIIARTEIVRISHEGNISRMRQKGTEKVEFISAPEDGRLCEKCKERDGRIYELKDTEGMIPLHPNCRCLVTEYYGDW